MKRVNWGEEFQFYYKSEGYWISMNKEGYYLTRGKDGDYQSFISANELFEKGRIEGKSIQEVWEEVEI